MFTRFVLITTQRTGATFFRTSLESHPDVECPGTLFPQQTRLKYFSVDRHYSYYKKYRTRTLRNRISHWIDRKALIHGCLNEAYGDAGANVKARGFKISYSNFERYPEIIDWIQQHDIQVIHWIRRDLVKRHVSKLTMSVRGRAHFTEPANQVKVFVDLGDLRRDLERQSFLIEKYREIFQLQRRLEVFYEDFVSDPVNESRRVLGFLGVDERVPLSSGLVKQNPENLRDIVSNFDQLADVLRGTRFEKHLPT